MLHAPMATKDGCIIDMAAGNVSNIWRGSTNSQIWASLVTVLPLISIMIKHCETNDLCGLFAAKNSYTFAFKIKFLFFI